MAEISEEEINEIKLEIKSIIISNTSRMTIDDLLRDYRKITGKNLTELFQNYKKLETFLKINCKDILKLQFQGGKTEIYPIISERVASINQLIIKSKTMTPHNKRSAGIYSNTSSPSNVSNSNVSLINKNNENVSTKKGSHKSKPTKSCNRNLNYNIKQNVQSNLRLLIQEEKKILSSELMSKYNEKFHENFPLHELGFNSIISLCASFTDIFTIRRIDKYGDWVIYDKNLDTNDSKHSSNGSFDQNLNNRNDDNSNISEVDRKIFGLDALPGIELNPSLFPSDCVNFDYEIPKVEIPITDSQFDIMVTEVVDPLHFWFFLKSNSNSNELDILMADMHNFYVANSYEMVRAAMRPGQYCAVPYLNVYHRAMIVKNIDMYVVKVLYVDYGTVCDVQCNKIKYLLKKYAELPIQAIRGRLADIKPLPMGWTSVARKYFLNLVINETLVAKIVERENNNILHLNIYVTSSMDLVISKVLCDEGFAVLNTDKKDGNVKYLLPSFEDLEAGIAPNFDELEKREIQDSNILEICLNGNKTHFDEKDTLCFNETGMKCLNLNENDTVKSDSVKNLISEKDTKFENFCDTKGNFNPIKNYDAPISRIQTNSYSDAANICNTLPWNNMYQVNDQSWYVNQKHQYNQILPANNMQWNGGSPMYQMASLVSQFNQTFPQNFIPFVNNSYFNQTPYGVCPQNFNNSQYNDQFCDYTGQYPNNNQVPNMVDNYFYNSPCKPNINVENNDLKCVNNENNDAVVTKSCENISDDEIVNDWEMLLSDDVKVNKEKKETESKITEASQELKEEIESSDTTKNDVKDDHGCEIKLLLVKIEVMAGYRIGIWKIESPKFVKKDHYVMVQQVCDIILDHEESQRVHDDFYSSNDFSNILYAQYEDVKKNEMLNGNQGEYIPIISLKENDEDVDIRDHVALVPLERFFNFICRTKSFKVNYVDLLDDLMNIIPSYW